MMKLINKVLMLTIIYLCICESKGDTFDPQLKLAIQCLKKLEVSEEILLNKYILLKTNDPNKPGYYLIGDNDSYYIQVSKKFYYSSQEYHVNLSINYQNENNKNEVDKVKMIIEAREVTAEARYMNSDDLENDKNFQFIKRINPEYAEKLKKISIRVDAMTYLANDLIKRIYEEKSRVVQIMQEDNPSYEFPKSCRVQSENISPSRAIQRVKAVQQ